jgi:hypothetical protein
VLLAAALMSGWTGANIQKSLVSSGAASAPENQGERAGVSGLEPAVLVAYPDAEGTPVPVQKKASTRLANGRLDEYIVFQYDQNDVLLLSQSKYSASGVLVEMVEFVYEDGRAVQKITRDEQGQPHARISYQYNAQGLITKEILSSRSGRVLSSYEYQYDSSGNRIVRIINNTQGNRLAETSFVYRNGLLISSETRDGTGRKTGSSENTYDERGNRLSETVFDATGQVLRVVTETWRNGRAVQLERANAGGRVLLRETYEYGAYNELVRKTIEDIQNQTKKSIEYEYTLREERL